MRSLSVLSGGAPSIVDVPRVGPEDVEHHADGGGLAGAVGTEQPEDLPGADLERHVFDGTRVAERLGKVLNRN